MSLVSRATVRAAQLGRPRKREVALFAVGAAFFTLSLAVAVPYCVTCLAPATVGMP